jgi:hypothetical protein
MIERMDEETIFFETTQTMFTDNFTTRIMIFIKTGYFGRIV